MNYPIAICLSSLLFAFLPQATVSVSLLPFVHYNKENSGLSYNGIRVVKQDARGYIWVGTHKGLSRYDGIRFKNYDRYDFGVASDYICALEEDATGDIWIGTDNGIVIYDYESDSFRSLGEWSGSEKIDDRIFAIISDPQGNMWIGTRTNGLLRCDLRKKTVQSLPIFDDNGNPVVNVYRIVAGRNGQLWVAVYCDDIYRLDAGADVLTRLTTDDCSVGCFHNDDVEGIAIDDRTDDILYVASKRNGLCEVNVRTGAVQVLLRLSDGHRPTDLGKSTGHYLWLSSTEGLFRYNIPQRTCDLYRNEPGDRFSLSDNYVTTSFVDDRDGLWIGTLNGGVNYYGAFQNNFRKYYRTSDGTALDGCIVRSFAEGPSGTVWIATEQMGLLKLDPYEGRLQRYAASRLPQSITALCCDGDTLWIGTQNGICRLSLQSDAVTTYALPQNDASASDNRIISLYRSKEGIVYSATAIGILKWDPEHDRFRTLNRLEGLTVEHMAEDACGNIWMASYSDGVFVYDPAHETLEHYCTKDGTCPIPEMTSSMCIDDRGDIWVIGFSSGIFRYRSDTDAFVSLDRTRLPSLPSDIYFSAVPDGRGNIWLSSDNGLVKYNPDNGLVKVFTTDDGLLDMVFKKSALALSDGTLLFGSANGFIRFDPAEFDTNPEPVGVTITDMEVGGVSRSPGTGVSANVDISQELRLAPRENSFGFSFAALRAPTSAYGRLLCRLEGYDSDWRDVSTTRKVAFYNVPAGRYRLQLKTKSYDGSDHSAHDDVQIVVEPRFWESPAGIALIMLLLLSLAGIIFRILYVRALNEEKRKQEAYEKKRDTELYNEKITFFSNIVHEIKTPLTLIKTPLHQIISSSELTEAASADLEIIWNSTEYLDKLVKELLDFVRVEKHGYELDIRTVDIVEKLGFLCFNFAETAKAKNVKLQYRHDEECIWVEADESALNKILNNLLHNAVKYAESEIDVHIYQENGRVSVTIRNDGQLIPTEHRESIFKPFVSYSNHSDNYSQSFGIGLALARTFAELHRGVLFLDEDASCTKFVLHIPACTGGGREADPVPAMKLNDYIKSSDKPLIVLAEDNRDLSSYLKRKLGEEFRVVAVPSAEQALALLKRYPVNMLVTDIALQHMNGVELCRRVSTDIETSHIPIAVVSAIASDETKIECMNNGAAIYIEKPFSLEYLMSCIRNILEQRNKTRSSFDVTRLEEWDSERFGLPDIDEEFLRRFDRIIMENLGNPEFSNKQLEEQLFLSHSTLNRKVKALLNMTPNDYLRKKRLSVAAHLLETEGSRINEVCRAVGFSSPSYFSKCFKEQYGLLPMEYRMQHLSKE